MSFKVNSTKASAAVKHQSKNSVSICDEHVLQYARPGQNDECELVIGLDFGTSASKVVIQAPDLPGRPSYPVNFAKFSYESMPYLLPTKMWVARNGSCTLEPRHDAQQISNIKIELFSRNENLNINNGPTQQELSPEEAAASYLALLLRYSRRWFLETKQDLVRHFKKIRWSVNLGVPSPCIEDNEENRIFQRVGKAAWMLSTLSEKSINLGNARKELEWVKDPEYWETDDDYACDFEIIPEIAAGAVGYALSDLRKEGLHLMVDIGASTVDVCSFNLQECEEGDRYSLLISDVQQLGTIRLYNARVLALERVYKKKAEDLLNKHEPLAPIEEDEDVEQFLVSRELFISAVAEAKAELKKQFLTMLRRVIWQTKLRRAPRTSVWRTGRLPILFVGGGSKIQFFRSAVEELDDWLQYHTKNHGILLLSAPVPESFTHLEEIKDDYHFLAVTWGLSHRAMDVGEIIPADSIPDEQPPPPPPDWRRRYIGKELV